MKSLKKLMVAAIAVITGALTSTAAPKAVGSGYEFDFTDDAGNKDNAYFGLLSAADNLLLNIRPVFTDSDHDWYNGGNYYELQTEDFICVSDGKIPYHRMGWGPDWNDRWENRALLPQDSSLTWTWDTPEALANVRIYTQWPDGWRTDVSVKSIEVKIGDNWTTLDNSAFDFAHFADLNTVQPHQAGLRNRMVTFADEDPLVNLATGVTGLRITFGNQSNDICYGCYWEIEAKRGRDMGFLVKNTVNGDTEYAGRGEVQIAVLPNDAAANAYQVTVNGAAPDDDAWLAYTAGAIPEDVIVFELPQELDATTSFTLYLRGDDKAAYVAGTTSIKSAYGAQPILHTKGNINVILPNEYDGVTVTRDQILALNASEDTHGGILSVEAEDTVVDSDNPTVSFKVTNLGGTVATQEVTVNITPAKGPLPQDYLALLLHLGKVHKTDDIKDNDDAEHDYLTAYGGQQGLLAYAGLVCTGLDTSDGSSEPKGTLTWTALKNDGGTWHEDVRDNYVKYFQIYINSPTERDIVWSQKSDDSLWVWVNGELQSHNDYTGDFLNFNGHLRRGINVITIKFREVGGGDNMSVAIRKPDGQTYFDDLTYQLYPDFTIRDAGTGSFTEFTTDAIKVAYMPKLKGFTRYQIVRDDFQGSARPDDGAWFDYVPGEVPSAPIPCAQPELIGDAVYYTLFLANDDGSKTASFTATLKGPFEKCGDVAARHATITSPAEGEYVLTFAESGELVVTRSMEAEILLVGGGGGGGSVFGGGGGGGGVVHREAVKIPKGTYAVTVGAGGIGASFDGSVNNTNGGDSRFLDLVAYGGGAGGGALYNGGYYDGRHAGLDGASGGGASGHRTDFHGGDPTVGKGLAGQGHDGGTPVTQYTHSLSYNYKGASGGGGGAGEVGGAPYQVSDGSDYMGGTGGAGVTFAISGAEVCYGGGGGGGSNFYGGEERRAPGGNGGGGQGGYCDYNGIGQFGMNGTDGLGGGGGGGGCGDDCNSQKNGTGGGNGGSGVVIIRFKQTFADASKPGIGGTTVVKKNGWMIHTFRESGKFYIPNSVKAQVLLVGGGGGGGAGQNGGGGGGGAGGMLVLDAVEVSSGIHEVTVGPGGLGGVGGGWPSSGMDSTFLGYTAFGGGYGGGIWNEICNGANGGSGGGAYAPKQWDRAQISGGTGVEGQGHDGASTTLTGDESTRIDKFGAGGGGAGSAGSVPNTALPGLGGEGRVCDYSGEEVIYAAGGNGGTEGDWYGEAQPGRPGGGGASGYWFPVDNVWTDVPGDAVDGTGSGGGGGGAFGNSVGRGGNGGSGIVIIRYRLRQGGLTIYIK